MSREIPVNDTPTPQDVWDHPLTYHSQNIATDDKESDSYHAVFLPYKIWKFWWEVGDCLILEKVEDDPVYIRGTEAPAKYDDHQRLSSDKGVYKIHKKGSNRPRIRVPAMWADEFLNHGGDEALTVELNEVEGEPHIRIYEGSDYEDRKDSLKAGNDAPKMGPSRVLGPLGAAYGASEAVSDTESLELDVPDQVSEGSVVPVSVEANLPELQKILIQHRVQGEPGFTDIETASASDQAGNVEYLSRPFRLDASYDLSENEGAEIHEFRIRVRYDGENETLSSEVQEVRLQ